MEWTAEELQAIVDEHDLVLFMKERQIRLSVDFLTAQPKFYNNLVNHLPQSIF